MTDELGPEAYSRWRQSPLGSITEELEHQAISAMLPTGKGLAVLDAGCGDGAYALQEADRGAVVTALDLSLSMLIAARERAQASGAVIRWCRGDIRFLPFADCSFDVVMAVTVLCSVESPVRAVREFTRILKPGGILEIGELGRWSTWAIERRLRARLGARFWKGTRFWTFSELRKLISQCGLVCTATRGAIYYPPCSVAARLVGPWDRKLSFLGGMGAAFLAVKAEKSERVSPSSGPTMSDLLLLG